MSTRTIVIIVVLILAVPLALTGLKRTGLLSRWTASEAGAEPAARERNQRAAETALRSIAGAEGRFAALSGHFGVLEDLAHPPGGGPPLIAPRLADGEDSGYVFLLDVRTNADTGLPTYLCTAEPATPGATGVRRYRLDESGMIRFTEGGTEPTAKSRLLE